MTEDDEIELGNLDFSIDQARKGYFRLRDHLQLLMNEAGGPPEAAQTLMTFAEEFGADFVMEKIARQLEWLGPSFMSATRLQQPDMVEKVADVLNEVTFANAELGELIGAREGILCANDPNRKRIYNFDGRDVVLDIANGTVRFVDEPGLEEALVIEAVEPSNEPTRDFLRELKREQERRRERRR